MRESYGNFEDLGAQIIVIAPHNARKMASYWEENKLPFPGIPDPDGKLGRLYGQQRKILKFGLMPAQFVIDTQGQVVYAHYASSMKDIPSNELILSIIDPHGKLSTEQ
jgi:peroxiredoxin